MAWIESHQTLANHPKTLKLARVLNVPRVTAVGHLHFLWWWALDYAQSGDLSGFEAMDIAVAADWQGEPEAFVVGLQRAGFLDDDGQIHDWDEYAGRLIERRRADAERKRAARSQDVRRTSTGHPEDGVRNRTVPNRTQQNRTEPDHGESGADAPAKPKRATQVPEDWTPGETDEAWAVKAGFGAEDVARETPKFVRHHRSKGNTFKEIGLAWRNWMDRSREYGPARASPNGARGSDVDYFAAVARGEA